jgi:hypothetical protein
MMKEFIFGFDATGTAERNEAVFNSNREMRLTQ